MNQGYFIETSLFQNLWLTNNNYGNKERYVSVNKPFSY